MPPNMLEVLDGVLLPATVPELVQYAQDQDASEEVLDAIQAMPDRVYDSMAEISRNLGLLEDLPGSANLWSSADSTDIGTAVPEEKQGPAA